MAETKLFLNGIDADTGAYLMEPMTVSDIAARIRSAQGESSNADRLSASLQNLEDPHLGLPFTVQPDRVEQAGWGVVFHKDEPPEVRAAVMELFEHRRKQIKNDAIVKVLEDYRPGDDLPTWLARHGVAQGSVVPQKVPFYLLLVGGPDRIPFEFGHHLDVEYCVGRLHFDTPAEYTAYVLSVVDYETAGTVPNSREAAFWSPRHAADSATQLSADHMVKPLVDGVPAQGDQPPEASVLQFSSYRPRKFWGPEALKRALLDVLEGTGGFRVPAFLFTASHGVGFGKGDARQREAQGALVCQDWPSSQPLDPPHYLAASDVSNDARVHGLVSFHFACFGAGTPARDSFVHKPGEMPPEIATGSFFARLPQRLLTHPKGGALACIGHVERAWGYSIVTSGVTQLLPFRNHRAHPRGTAGGLRREGLQRALRIIDGDSGRTTSAGRLRRQSARLHSGVQMGRAK